MFRFKSSCPECKHPLNVGQSQNSDGEVGLGEEPLDSVALCCYCGALLKFNEDLTLRICSELEASEGLSAERWGDVGAIRLLIKALQARKEGEKLKKERKDETHL